MVVARRSVQPPYDIGLTQKSYIGHFSPYGRKIDQHKKEKYHAAAG
jgi:hypothetical protein